MYMYIYMYGFILQNRDVYGFMGRVRDVEIGASIYIYIHVHKTYITTLDIHTMLY